VKVVGGIVGALLGFGVGLLVTEVILSNPANGSGIDWQFWVDIVLAVVGGLIGASVGGRRAGHMAEPG
jgi:hypothetical protein